MSTDNDDPLEILSKQSNDSQSQDSGVQDPTPDSNQIVGRLMQIRDYLKQATSMKESLEKDSVSLCLLIPEWHGVVCSILKCKEQATPINCRDKMFVCFRNKI